MAPRRKPEPPPPYNPEQREDFERSLAGVAGGLQETIVVLNQALSHMGKEPDWAAVQQWLSKASERAAAAHAQCRHLRSVVGPGFTSNFVTERDRAVANSLINLTNTLSLDVAFLLRQISQWTEHVNRTPRPAAQEESK